MPRNILPFVFASFLAASLSAAEPPNIVIILADDLGYADIGANGCRDIPTPNIDSIARNGVRFTDGHANHQVCAPSRAALMTGRYQHRFGFEYNSGPEASAAENYGLPRTELTLAERLKPLGYRTGMIGKWHLGFKAGLRPHERGFDEHFGFLSGARPYFPTPKADPLIRNGQPVEQPEYLTDAFGDEAVRFIKAAPGKPFFLYLPFNAIHGPQQAIAKYESRFPAIADPKRKLCAAMMSALDDAVGRVLDAIRERGIEENTLVFFYSDNGGPTAANGSLNTPLRGFKGQILEGGIRVPFLAQWKGKLPAGTVYDKPVMAFDIHATAIAAAGGTPLTDRPMDGVDLLPFLTGKNTAAPHDKLVWRQGDGWAIRMGDWKLVHMVNAAQTELYHLKDDLGESKDLAAAQPEKVKQLQAAYDAWAAEMIEPKWETQRDRPKRKAAAQRKAT